MEQLAAPFRLGGGGAVEDRRRITGTARTAPGTSGSGPLVLRISLPTTVVTLGAARSQDDRSLAEALPNIGEFAGVPVSIPGAKRYALGLVPISDAFPAWSKTAHPVASPGRRPARGSPRWLPGS